MVVGQLHFSEALEAPFLEVATGVATAPGRAPRGDHGGDDGDPRSGRVAALPALRRLARTVDGARDPALGLKAARHIRFGQVGVLDYLVATSQTVDTAFETLARYMALVTDTLTVRREATRDRVAICFQRPLATPPAASDFTLGGIYHCHRDTLFSQVDDLECWLPYPAPRERQEHGLTFGGVRLRFSALVMAFSFPRECLERPLPRRDARLHAILTAHAERTLAAMPASDTVAQRIMTLIDGHHATGLPSATQLARHLAMSPRTLGRKLELEGTTYSDLIATWRRGQALRHLSQPHPDMASIAAQLGYSHPVGFHRAFKRWTGQTPLGYHRTLYGRASR